MDAGLKECATDKDKQLLVQLILKGWISIKKETLLADELTITSNNGVTWRVRVIGNNSPDREEYWSNY